MMPGPVIWTGTEPLQRIPCGNVRCWAEGYATRSDGAPRIDTEFGKFLALHRDRLHEVAASLNGCFAAVLEYDGRIVMVTDRFGTVPIYVVRSRDGRYACSDDPWQIVPCLPAKPSVDPLALIDLLHTGYVTGDGTLLTNLQTAAPAAVSVLEGDAFSAQRYWTYAYNPEPMNVDDAMAGLADVFAETMARMSNLLRKMKARPVLTLSGGLDSRVLAALFARTPDLANASELSYGNETDPEVSVAAQVATALSWDLETVPVERGYLNSKFLDTSVREDGITTRFTCGTGARHLSEVPGWVLVPGNTGDFISGGHLPPHASLVANRAQFQRFLDLRHFQYPSSDYLLKQVLRIDRRGRFDSISRTTANFDFGQDMFGLIDRWNVENRQRRLILMELRAYERAARWVLPFYDYELVDFSARIPHPLRIGQYLYTQTALEKVFADSTAALGTIRRVGKPLHVESKSRRRHAILSHVPPMFRTPLLGSWPLARGITARLHEQRETKTGPDPIRYWFRTDPDTRAFFLEKMQEISLDEIDTNRLLELAVSGQVPEDFFHRLVTSAITAQESLTLAKRCWNIARNQESRRTSC